MGSLFGLPRCGVRPTENSDILVGPNSLRVPSFGPIPPTLPSPEGVRSMGNSDICGPDSLRVSSFGLMYPSPPQRGAGQWRILKVFVGPDSLLVPSFWAHAPPFRNYSWAWLPAGPLLLVPPLAPPLMGSGLRRLLTFFVGLGLVNPGYRRQCPPH